VKQQDSLDKEGFRGKNLDTENHSSREPTCECGHGTGPLQMVLTIGGTPTSVIVEGIAYCGS